MSAKTPNAYGIDPAALEAMRNGEAPTAPVAKAPAPKDPPAEEAEEEPAAEATDDATPPRRGNPDVPLRQLRQQLQQQEAMLRDPVQLAAYLRANGFDMVPLGTAHAAARAHPPAPDAVDPFAAFDPETAAALKSVVESATKPLQEKLAIVELERHQARHHANLLALEQEHPGLIAHTRAFDSVLPEISHVDPLVKHLTMLGNRMTDPDQHGVIVQELMGQMDPDEVQRMLHPIIQGHAVTLVADKLAPGNKGKRAHVTLGGALPARDNTSPKAIGDISPEEWREMSDKERDHYRG